MSTLVNIPKAKDSQTY